MPSERTTLSAKNIKSKNKIKIQRITEKESLLIICWHLVHLELNFTGEATVHRKKKKKNRILNESKIVFIAHQKCIS